MGLLHTIGDYVVLMAQTFKRPDKGKVFRKQLFIDFQHLGVDSIGDYCIYFVVYWCHYCHADGL